MDISDTSIITDHHSASYCKLFSHLTALIKHDRVKIFFKGKGYATRERFLKRIRQNPPNLRKILSRDGVFKEIVIARHAQLNRFSR